VRSAVYLGWTREDHLTRLPCQACNQCWYLTDVKHNTAFWTLIWVLVAASVVAIVYAAVLMPPS
jgi:hypothetical protein